MQRRNFIKDTTLFAAGISVFGTIQWKNGRFQGIDPTTTDILGPFYRPGAPIRTNIIPTGTKGTELLHLSGTVFKADGKTPYKDYLVEIWQCSPDGVYDNTSDDYKFRGAQKTGSDGKYHFISSLPVPYPIDNRKTIYRPAHIHMRVSGKGGQDLVTQIYFKGDPHIEKDLYAKAPQAVNRILSINMNSKNEKTVKFDVIMSKEFPLDNAAFQKITGIYQMDDKSMIEFYKNDDLLFAKINGQIMDALYYKGNNVFAGSLELLKVQFELQTGGEVKVAVDFFDDINEKWLKFQGSKMFKYKG